MQLHYFSKSDKIIMNTNGGEDLAHRIYKILVILFFAVLSAFLIYSAVKSFSPSDIVEEPTVDEFLSEDTTPDIPDKPEKEETEQLPTPHAFLSNLPDADSAERAVTDAVYDENCTIARWYVPDRSILPDKARYSIDLDMGDGTAVSQSYFTMWPRMGFILLADGENREILAPNGAVINVQDDHYLAFMSARTVFGTPVFLDCNTGKYVNLLTDGTITECDYDDKRDSRGIVFDYPSYFGQTDNINCKVVYNGRGFGYNIEGEDARNVPYSYEKAFSHSEGFGCAYDDDNRVYFFNETGRLRIGGMAINADMYGCGTVNDERALGYYYFDEGLTRITRRRYRRGQLISEYHTFIDREGNEFKTPDDYSVYSYSNGMILLEKDGMFGYMNSRGKWIMQPEYSYARPFFEGLAVVGEKDGKKGMIDRNGNYVIPPIFDEIADCSGGVITAYDKEMGWQVLNKQITLPTETVGEETAVTEE